MKIALATPSLNHDVCFEYYLSVLDTISEAVRENHRLQFMVRGGDQFIAKVRSKMMDEFLRSDADVLFFIDSDVGFPPSKVMEFVARPEPIIAGIYPKKQETTDWPVLLHGDGGHLHRNGDLIKAGMIPMGFTKIARCVVEDLAKQIDGAPEKAPTWFWEREADGEVRKFRGFFQSGIGPDHQWWGEDHAFCQNVMALGYDIWIDPNIDFHHRGNKRWSGNIGPSIPIFEERAAKAYAERDAEQNEEAA